MFSFAEYIDLPCVWGLIIAIGIFIYVFLDGFDLGIGILFPFAPSDECRNKMMNSIAPFWDGNETWLVLGGGAIFIAFPYAYSVLMPAFYIPIMLMLFGLIFRGVAFEFRYKSSAKTRILWDYAFHFGSLLATFMQGMMLGYYVQGIEVNNRQFAGHPFDWISGFSMMVGIAMVCGYVLLGSTWLIMKTTNITQAWSRKTASYILIFVGFFMALVSASMPFIDNGIATLWFNQPTFFYLMPIPFVTLGLFIWLWSSIHSKNQEIMPFVLSMLIFVMGYIGLGISIWPWIVPFSVTLTEAAAIPESQSLMLIAVAILLPVILFYTGYCYYVFRGKSTTHDDIY